MTDFNITGTVLHIGDTQVISDKFQKRNLELETGEPEYPQINEIQFTQDRVSLLNEIVEGAFLQFTIKILKPEEDNKKGKIRKCNKRANNFFPYLDMKMSWSELGRLSF